MSLTGPAEHDTAVGQPSQSAPVGLSPNGFAKLPDANSEWRRLSPRMLLIHPVREIGRFFPALLGVFFVGNYSGEGHWWTIGAGGLVIVLSILRWFTTRYRITPSQIQLRTGLFRRKALAASTDRVRTVDVTANILHRALGLAKVEIGTASVERKDRLVLDALPKEAAEQLRAELLHRRTPPPSRDAEVSVADESVSSAVAAKTGLAYPGEPVQERDLLRLDSKWIRYAPLTLSGVISALIIVGFGGRILNEIGGRIDQWNAIRSTTRTLESMSLWVAVIIVIVVLLVVITLLSIGGYILSFWGFRLSRHEGGTLHTARGLLTTRATSIEERRLRGVELVEPLLLRTGGGARLMAISTGLKAKGREGGGDNGALLVPPAPVAVARRVGAEVLRDVSALSAPLRKHSRAAARRRYARALLACLALIALAALSWKPGLPVIPDQPVALPLASLVLLPVGVLLARDRYRNLGHALHGPYFLRRTGSFVRRTSALQREGIIGWNLRQSFFQRRAGLATLIATTAGGRQQYWVLDIEMAQAVQFADQAVPGLLREFLV